jgi:pimeloyl-ACP methyl ester carboxylesterase
MAIHQENVTIPADGYAVCGTFISEQKDHHPGALFVHGWGASQEQCLPQANAVAELGCACLSFDLRGHGPTIDQRNRVSREDNLTDVIAAYDWLANRNDVEKSSIGIVGTSYGGYLAAIATIKRSISYLVLQAPAIYRDPDWLFPKVKLHEDPALIVYRRSVVSPNDNVALQACAAFTGDVLIIESQYDAIVPHPVSESYAAACAQARSLTCSVIANADHGLSEERWRNEYTSMLTKWIEGRMVQPMHEMSS